MYFFEIFGVRAINSFSCKEQSKFSFTRKKDPRVFILYIKLFIVPNFPFSCRLSIMFRYCFFLNNLTG